MRKMRNYFYQMGVLLDFKEVELEKFYPGGEFFIETNEE
jgi:hypothetical protein